jgi:hypothetical protein
MSVSRNVLRRVRVPVLACALAIAWSPAALLRAQGDRITLPRKPGPNQTLVVHLTQDMNMQMSMGGAPTGDLGDPAAGAPAGGQPPQRTPPPMNLTGNMMMEATQKLGDTDDQGRTPCEFTYTDANMDMKMNGMALPNQDFKTQFVGKSMTFAYAPDGTVTDLKLPEDSRNTAALRTSMQQALGSFTMSMPTQPLSVGETAKMPVTVPLQMPMPGGATPPSFKGTVTYTLVRIEGSGNNRVAILDQKMDATAEGALPAPGAGQPAGALTMHMTGTGQIQVDLARGVARSGEIQTTMEGTIKRQAPPSDSPQAQMGAGDVRLQGTTKMKMSTTPQDR